MTRNSCAYFLDFSIKRAETFAPLINQMNLINSNKVKSVNEREVVKDVLFKFLGECDLWAGKNMSVSARSNLLLDVFMIVFTSKYHAFFLRNAIDHQVLFGLK